MDELRIYPVAYSDVELAREAAELSKRVTAYDRHGGNAEDLIKDSVLFNITYIELQNRKAQRVSKLMIWLTCLSAAVALASLLVAWFAYETTRASDKWQDEHIRLLGEISKNLSLLMKDSQQKAVTGPPKSPHASVKKSGANSTLQGTPASGRP